jgi:hypothetical protein
MQEVLKELKQTYTGLKRQYKKLEKIYNIVKKYKKKAKT